MKDRRFRAAGLTAGMVALVFLLLAWQAGPLGLRHYSCLAAGALLGISLGMLLICSGPLEFFGKPGGVAAELGLVSACGILLLLLSYWCGMRQFGGADEGVVVDVAWRLFSGQRPYVDFPCTLPVGFYLGAELAFRLFGVYWRSIVALNAIWGLVSFFWLYAILRGVYRNLLLAFWTALTCVVTTTVVAAFWWYNPVTSICAALYAASVVAVILGPDRRWRWISLCLSLFLVALVKPNVAAPLIIGGTISLFAFRPTRLPAAATSLLALLLWFLAIHIHGSTPQEVIHSYLSVAPRGMALDRFLRGILWPEIIVGVVLLLAVLAPWFARVSRRSSNAGPGWPIVIFVSFCVFAGVYGFLGNSDLSIIHLPVILLAGSFVVTDQVEGQLALSKGWTRYLTFLCVWLTCLGLSQAVIRHKIKTIGDFFEFRLDPRPFNVPFFEGLHAGPVFHSVVDDIGNLCITRDMSHAYFALRLEWAYAAFRLPPPEGEPLWWEPGATFAEADEARLLENWVSGKFNPIVLMDPAFMDDQVCDAIGRRYGLLSENYFNKKGLAPLHVLVLRDQGGSSLPPWQPHDMAPPPSP
jgi:hypothetical protein